VAFFELGGKKLHQNGVEKHGKGWNEAPCWLPEKYMQKLQKLHRT